MSEKYENSKFSIAYIFSIYIKFALKKSKIKTHEAFSPI